LEEYAEILEGIVAELGGTTRALTSEESDDPESVDWRIDEALQTLADMPNVETWDGDDTFLLWLAEAFGSEHPAIR
jgi:hypothetical protein